MNMDIDHTEIQEEDIEDKRKLFLPLNASLDSLYSDGAMQNFNNVIV